LAKTKINAKINRELKNKTVLITGGAGSIGSELAKKILEFPVDSLRIFDVDEHALFQLGKSIKDSRLRLLLGDTQNTDRVDMAGTGTDIVIHLAAVKNIEITEFNPIETININVNGTVNMIKMAIKNKPSKFLNISTDKSVEASTLYGTTKQLGERVTSWAGHHIETTKFASVRIGNVIESRGNVFSVWKEEIKNKKLISVTEPKMKRYFFHVNEAVEFILNCLPLITEGEIFVPKMNSYSIQDLADKTSKKQKIIGLRQGEKIKEILITKDEKSMAMEKKNMWIIRPYANS
jgi:FlaA1/EpsC-like NDP-sugar epimerase